MTYNILTGGRDGLRSQRLEKILEVVEREQPDLLALQECNFFDAEARHVFHWFERRLEMRGVLAHAQSGFHVAVFTKGLPFLSSSEINGWCQHAMLKTKVLWEGEPLDFVSVHHNPFSGSSRLTETEFLAAQSRPEALQLIMGDFNATSPRDAERVDIAQLPTRYRSRHTYKRDGERVLDTRSIGTMLDSQMVDLYAHCNTGWEPTVPTPLMEEKQRYPMRIDFAFASGTLASRASACRVVKSKQAEQASDHYPLVVDFDKLVGA